MDFERLTQMVIDQAAIGRKQAELMGEQASLMARQAEFIGELVAARADQMGPHPAGPSRRPVLLRAAG